MGRAVGLDVGVVGGRAGVWVCVCETHTERGGIGARAGGGKMDACMLSAGDRQLTLIMMFHQQ